jgi:dTDP-4-dehydrorhamnose 3,5-epimerase
VIFIETKLKGAFVVEPELLEDDRGFFARSWCHKEFAEHGLNPALVQCSISFNKYKQTLRGMHYQVHPFKEDKLVRCTRGAVYDVIIDLREDSPTFTHWIGVELTADNRRMLYVPKGFAHGFQTVEDESEVFYQISEFYHKECCMCVRWNDPAFAIEWPLPDPILSDRDRNCPVFSEDTFLRNSMERS